jgi:prepilin-type N-terminal cleavage/methylation domain-containing protein
MPTSAKDKDALARRRQSGVTLIELLVTLSILSMGALIAANAVNNRLPQQTVNQIAERLVADLKRARLYAQQTGDAVTVHFTADEYSSGALAIGRILPSGMSMGFGKADDAIVEFSSSFAHSGSEIRIQKGRASAVVLVHPITGKIERID